MTRRDSEYSQSCNFMMDGDYWVGGTYYYEGEYVPQYSSEAQDSPACMGYHLRDHNHVRENWPLCPDSFEC